MDCLRDWFFSALTQGTDNNGGILWISYWKLLKAGVGSTPVRASENCRPWAPGCKRSEAEEYSRTSKVLRINRDKTFRKINRF